MAMDQQSGIVSEGLFGAYRTNGAPTYYSESHTPWQADILEAGLIFCGCIIALAFYSILPGIHGKSRVYTFIWVTVAVYVGTVILVTNYSYDWESSEISTPTKYKAGTGQDIHAKVGLHIGLRGINVTLKGEPVHQLNETINYNEHFGWAWEQGRIGFGPFASQFNQEYRAAQFRGIPLPILWIAEYFTFDGEGIRWGRFYKEAGLYAHMCLWLAFGSWLLANIMVFLLIRYGAYLSMLTGISMLTANIIKHSIKNTLDLKIPFSSEHILVVQYGTAFWLCFVTGWFCVVCGVVILVLDLRLPWIIAAFFRADVLQDGNYLTKEDSTVSRSDNNSQASLATNDSDLTEIVEIDGDGNRVQRTAVRPQGAPQTGSLDQMHGQDAQNVVAKMDDVFCENNWSDVSDSDIHPTDDEFESEEEIKTTETTNRKPRGFLERFQVNRRRPSVQGQRTSPNTDTPDRRRRFPFQQTKKNYLKASKPRITKVRTITPAEFPEWR